LDLGVDIVDIESEIHGLVHSAAVAAKVLDHTLVGVMRDCASAAGLEGGYSGIGHALAVIGGGIAWAEAANVHVVAILLSNYLHSNESALGSTPVVGLSEGDCKDYRE
jgi:hypothetical protein